MPPCSFLPILVLQSHVCQFLVIDITPFVFWGIWGVTLMWLDLLVLKTESYDGCIWWQRENKENIVFIRSEISLQSSNNIKGITCHKLNVLRFRLGSLYIFIQSYCCDSEHILDMCHTFGLHLDRIICIYFCGFMRNLMLCHIADTYKPVFPLFLRTVSLTYFINLIFSTVVSSDHWCVRLAMCCIRIIIRLAKSHAMGVFTYLQANAWKSDIIWDNKITKLLHKPKFCTSIGEIQASDQQSHFSYYQYRTIARDYLNVNVTLIYHRGRPAARLYRVFPQWP